MMGQGGLHCGATLSSVLGTKGDEDWRGNACGGNEGNESLGGMECLQASASAFPG